MRPDQVGAALPVPKVIAALQRAGWLKDKEVVMSKRDKDVHVVYRRAPAWWGQWKHGGDNGEWPWSPWVVTYQGVQVDRLVRQADAIVVGRSLAQHVGCDLVVHGKNGRIRRKDSFGHDPRRRKG